MRRLSVVLAALILASCAPRPETVTPALWRVESPDGQRGWLFGTVHALDAPVDWRSQVVAQALDDAGTIMVEVARLDDAKAMTATFEDMATTPGQPPLSRRVSPALRDRLLETLARTGLKDRGFAQTETWAAALTLARAQSAGMDSANGIDAAIIRGADPDRIVQLEGLRGQLGLFDALPEREQRDLLDSVVRDGDAIQGEDGALVDAWKRGDMETIARETDRGLLADPELRAVLLTGRNRRWVHRIARAIDNGRAPFVAVGAAHMAGPEGLPALLAKRGFAVSRVQ